MPGDKLSYEDFEALVGSEFVLPGTPETPPLRFTLTDAKRLDFGPVKEGFRKPFQLLLRSTGEHIHPQGLYQLSHAELGEQILFLVPMAKDERGVDYCVTFN